MKRTIKALAVMLLAALMLVCFATPAFAEFDFDKYIEEFEPDHFNDQQLEVGDQHMPTARVWVQNGRGNTYCSDDTVVSVDEQGIVTAIGPGTAYVIYMGSTGMYQTYRYTVADPTTETVTEETDEVISLDQEVTLQLVKPIIDAPFQHVELEVDEPVSSAENVGIAAMFTVLGGFFVSLVGALASIANVGKIMIFFAAVPLSIGLVLLLLLPVLVLSSNSMKEKKLPPRATTANTVTTPAAILTNCPKCGTAFGNGEFCPKCGTAKMVKKVYTFPIKGSMTAQKFEKMANEWLAENPYIYNCKLTINKRASLLSPLVTYKFFVKSASIEYLVAEKPQPQQYGVAFIYKFRLFGPIGYSEEKHVEEWKANNPDAKVISNTGGRIQHFGTRSGFYAQYYNYVFFKK